MAEDPKTKGFGKIILNWEIPEYEKHQRSRSWYLVAGLLALGLLLYSFYTSNFLFAAIIIISTLIIIIHDGQEPMIINFGITDQGVILGKKFYDYDVLKDFSIIYKPHNNIKNLYFEFKNAMKPRLSIPLNDLNPLPIRESLLKYLPEDLERTDQPASEALARRFKL